MTPPALCMLVTGCFLAAGAVTAACSFGVNVPSVDLSLNEQLCGDASTPVLEPAACPDYDASGCFAIICVGADEPCGEAGANDAKECAAH
jgi:hypothetical protein